MSQGGKSLLIVVSGPSGVGKTTLCHELLEAMPGIWRSVSCTTRPIRGKEKNGKEYFFLSEAEFDRKLATRDLLEHAVVHGHRYGTPRKNVEDMLAAGRDVLLTIDVQGAAQVRKALETGSERLKSALLDVFILPPSNEALEERLRGRAEDPAAVVKLRLENAVKELADAPLFRYRIVNDRIDRASKELRDLVVQMKQK